MVATGNEFNGRDKKRFVSLCSTTQSNVILNEEEHLALPDLITIIYNYSIEWLITDVLSMF